MQQQRPLPRRMEVVVAFLLGGFLLFIGQSYRLQIMKAEEHLARAQWGVDSVSRFEAPRGAIIDRDGDLLAESATAVTLAYDPRLLLTEDRDQLSAVIAELSRFERFDAAELEAWRAVAPEDIPRYRVIARGVSPGEADALLDRLRGLGVRAVMRSDGFRRFYPNGDLAGRTIGFLDAHGEAGVAGLELAMDDTLDGGAIEVRVARDASREPYLLDEVPDLQTAAGSTVQITIDRELQEVAENALQAALDEYHAEAGVVVVSRVETGELLALAARPGFDPQATLTGEGDGWRNPAVASLYEPGSTAKMITFSAALQEGAVGYETEFDCENGAVMVDRYRIRDRHCHGSILAWEVIRDSSNIGALRMGMRMPQERHREYLLAFGFGERSGIPLPGEAAGVVPSLDRPWAASQHATISYGYGFSVTPLQLNMATAAIANGGVRMHPLLIRRVIGPDETVTEEFEPQAVGRVISRETAELVTRALTTVVSADGTARLAAVPGYEVAGKTGTARLLSPSGGYAENAYLAAFTGFVPADAPRFAITVMVERPDPELGYYGGVVAAPVFAAVARRALELDGLPVGEPTLRGPVEHAASAEVTQGIVPALPTLPAVGGARVVPDFSGMTARQALVTAAGSGLNLAVEGTGVIAEQWPAAASPATPGLTVVVTLENQAR